MSESPLIEQEVAALHTLEQLAAERSRAESETEQGFHTRRRRGSEDVPRGPGTGQNAAQSEVEATKARYQSVRAEINSGTSPNAGDRGRVRRGPQARSPARYNAASNAAKKDGEARWQALAVFEAAKDDAIKQIKEVEAEIKAAADELLAGRPGGGRSCPLRTCDGSPRSAPEVPARRRRDAVRQPDPELHERDQVGRGAARAAGQAVPPQVPPDPELHLAVPRPRAPGAYPLVGRLGWAFGSVWSAWPSSRSRWAW